MPRLAATLVPITTYVVTTAPLGERLAEVVGYRGGISDSDRADNHYRIVGGDRLMWSGRATVWRRNPARYRGALAADIKKTYPQLGDVAVDYAWSGTLGNTVHRMPQIGELGPGVWLASGFGGHGLNTTAMAGNIIARAIVSGDQTWTRFTPFELVWAGGLGGRAAVQMRIWINRLRQAIQQRRAKARELAHRQARDAEIAAEAAQAARQSQQSEAQGEAAMPDPPAPEAQARAAAETAAAETAAALEPSHPDSIVPPAVEMDDAGAPEPSAAPPRRAAKRRKRRHRAET
jgi:hypothetical protein